MNKLVTICAVLFLMLAVSGVAQAIAIDTVSVGNANNSADITTYGSVAYNYNIGKYEVTAGQYAAFLNAKAKCDSDPYGLYNTGMADELGCKIQRSGNGDIADPYVYTVTNGYENRPVNYVSFWDATRFTNWLHNGQGNGDTENGAYTLTVDGIANNTITRNAGWNWAVASEDEWYKAAYYKGSTSTYYDYPTGSDTAPAAVYDGTTADTAVFYDDSVTPNLLEPANVNNAGGLSPYRTMGQGGNVWEWNDAIIGENRGIRGGSFLSLSDNLLATDRGATFYGPATEDGDIGFRVVPEPATLALLSLGGLLLRRKK
jgi:formylglycine-generating enzyme required for sulfatase activity